MPGRDDFAIVRAGLLTDARAHAAAELYIQAGLATEHTALAAVVGHVAMLALWASRDTYDGVLPCDGMIAASAALFAPRATAKTIVESLTTAGQLRKSRRGLYLVGFRDCYSAIRNKREVDRLRKAQDRKAKQLAALAAIKGVAPTSDGHPADVRTLSERTEAVPDRGRTEAGQNPPAPDRSATGTDGVGVVVSDDDREDWIVVRDRLATGAGGAQWAEWAKRRMNGGVTDSDIRSAIDMWRHRDDFRIACLGNRKLRKESGNGHSA